MPNHLHALIAFRNTGQSINTIIGNGKRFIAYEIIKRLELQGAARLLHNLNLAVEAKDKERNKKHEVWETHLTGKNAEVIHSSDKSWITYTIIRAGANGIL